MFTFQQFRTNGKESVSLLRTEHHTKFGEARAHSYRLVRGTRLPTISQLFLSEAARTNIQFIDFKIIESSSGSSSLTGLTHLGHPTFQRQVKWVQRRVAETNSGLLAALRAQAALIQEDVPRAMHTLFLRYLTPVAGNREQQPANYLFFLKESLRATTASTSGLRSSTFPMAWSFLS